MILELRDNNDKIIYRVNIWYAALALLVDTCSIERDKLRTFKLSIINPNEEPFRYELLDIAQPHDLVGNTGEKV